MKISNEYNKGRHERMSELYPWPEEKVEEFVTSLLATAETSSVSQAKFASTNSPSLVSAAQKSSVSSEDYYASRQAFLRGYTLTRKPSATTKLTKWFTNMARALVH